MMAKSHMNLLVVEAIMTPKVGQYMRSRTSNLESRDVHGSKSLPEHPTKFNNLEINMEMDPLPIGIPL
jgi:hypothetical protein